jgi:hypothetical protein
MATNDLIPTALVATGMAPVAIPGLAPTGTAQKDRFASQAGPDVSYKGPGGTTEAYAVFQIDPASRKLSVTVVDEHGQVIRTIPPQSVSQMMESMGRYRP